MAALTDAETIERTTYFSILETLSRGLMSVSEKLRQDLETMRAENVERERQLAAWEEIFDNEEDLSCKRGHDNERRSRFLEACENPQLREEFMKSYYQFQANSSRVRQRAT